MPRGGKREGAGAKRKPKLPVPAVNKGMALRILEQIEEESKVITLLDESFTNDRRLFWEILKELQHQAGRKPVSTVNHVHDKPLEIHHHFDLADRIAKARGRLKK